MSCDSHQDRMYPSGAFRIIRNRMKVLFPEIGMEKKFKSSQLASMCYLDDYMPFYVMVDGIPDYFKVLLSEVICTTTLRDRDLMTADKLVDSMAIEEDRAIYDKENRKEQCTIFDRMIVEFVLCARLKYNKVKNEDAYWGDGHEEILSLLAKAPITFEQAVEQYINAPAATEFIQDEVHNKKTEEVTSG